MGRFKLGIIGFGARGTKIMNKLFEAPIADIVAICDVCIDKAESAARLIYEYTGVMPYITADYSELLMHGGIDGVLIATAWESHVAIAVASMRMGIPTCLEVGGAYSQYECHELVRTYEETKTPFMFFENCCFDETELWITSMVRNGVFGEVVHCSGCYAHDLRREMASGNYRSKNYMLRNCENYQTHELGPIAKLLNINRGNRMVSLVSVASKTRGIEDFVKKNPDKVHPSVIGKKFMQGDIITTVIKCANGETIHIRLDTTLPRMYDRGFTVHGTMAYSTSKAICIDGEERMLSFDDGGFDKYKPMCIADLSDDERARGLGDKDIIALNSFIEAVRNKTPMPIDVYDAAAWMVISCLSEVSVAEGGKPQVIPDFTHGEWLRRETLDVVELPKVNEI